jgi:hypothetical protein
VPAPVAFGGFPAHYYASANSRFASMLNLAEPLPADKLHH